MCAAAIEIRDLVKTYPRRSGGTLTALRGLSLDVPRGQIFGLLGPNGAGKSTLINILSGLTRKTSGSVTMWGFDLDKDAREARAAIGVAPQEVSIDPFFTPQAAVAMQAGLYGVRSSGSQARALLRTVDLDTQARAWARSLSGGMRRRLMIAKAMAHDPPIIALDEPTAGVDVALRERLWEQARSWRSRGATVILTTHYLEEAQLLCDRIAVIDKGALAACDEVGALLARYGRKVARVEVSAALPEGVALRLEALGVLSAKVASARALEISCRPGEGVMRVLAWSREAGLEPQDIVMREADLHDVFAHLTREPAAASAGASAGIGEAKTEVREA